MLATSVLLCAACGRVGFATSQDAAGHSGGDGAADSDSHLHTAGGWSIAQFVDLGAGFSYVQHDFVDGNGSVVRDNAPSYIAALSPPFTAELAVIAGRSVIEIAADGHMTPHDYRPATPDMAGPDVPGRMTYADLGGGDAALWLTSSSVNGGDGLYRIAPDWSMQPIHDTNNIYALVFDAAGSFDAQAAPGLYFVARQQLSRQITGVATALKTALPPSVDDLAVVGNALYFTVETQTQIGLYRLGPGAGYLQNQLTDASSTDLALAEGPADAGLFAIRDDAALVRVDPASGSFTQVAWSDDADWVWRAACVPRAGHRLAGHVIVIESNRVLDRDRLLVIAPQ